MHVFPRVFHFSVTLRISFDFQLNVVSLQSTSITINQLTKNIRRPTDWPAKYRDGGLRGNVLWGTPFLPLVPSVSRRLAPPILLFSISVKRMPHKFFIKTKERRTNSKLLYSSQWSAFTKRIELSPFGASKGDSKRKMRKEAAQNIHNMGLIANSY